MKIIWHLFLTSYVCLGTTVCRIFTFNVFLKISIVKSGIRPKLNSLTVNF